ncbi:MAG: TonB-dependent receptor domain-containing protein [Bryobacteraceae bacterium]
MKGKSRVWVLLVGWLWLLGQPALAQRTTANLYGIVTDTTGAAVPRIVVTLVNELTGTEQIVTTNEIGEFSATFLALGRYTVTVRAQGFKTFVQKGLELTAGQQIRYPITLEVGNITEKIEVTAEAPLLQNASVQTTDNITSQQIQELPQARRDFTQLLSLQTGMVRNTTEYIQINGLAGVGITVTVDGVDAGGDSESSSLSAFQGANIINVLSQEAIQEVNVAKGVVSAEVGRAFSGNINLISKGGTNEFHGSLFENWQNDILNARNALLAPTARKPPIRFNQFGGSVGGPIIRDKAFFFFAYEGYRQSNFALVTAQMPTPEFRTQAIAAVPAYKDILTLFQNPSEPYATGAASGLFRGASADEAHDNHIVFRGDYNLRSNDRLSGRYTRGRPFRNQPSALPTNRQSYTYAADSGNVSWVHSAPGWTTETRAGLNYTDAQRLQQAYTNGIPGITVQGANFSVGAEFLTLTGHTYSIEEVVSKPIGRHTVKFGGSYFVQAPGRFDEEIPVFTYASAATFLANQPSQVQFTFGVPRFHGKTWNVAAFVQDDFKVRSNLILNLGVRYEYYSVFKDKEGFLVNAGSPSNAFSNPPRYRPTGSFYNADKNNFLPRIGFAWSPGQGGKNVIRGGFGMTVAPFNLRNFYTLAAYDPRVIFRYRFTGGEVTRLNLKYPITNAQMLPVVRNENIPRAFEIFFEDNPNPYTMQWTFDLQRQLSPTLVFQTGYVGNKGLKIHQSHTFNLPDRVTGIRPVPSILESNLRDSSDFSVYHAWQTSLKKRMSHDLAFNVNYTWSRNMALSQGDYWGGNDPEVQDETNYRADYGPVTQNRTHSLTLDTIYDTPFDRWLKAGSVLKHVVGGWQIAGILGVANGAWLNAVQPSTFLSSRPDYNGANPYLDGGDRFLYLNRAAFTLIPTGPSGAPIRPGNLGKNALRGPSYWNLDLSLSKDFKFHERYGLKFRADMFNATNSVRLGNPILQVNNALFGRITAVFPARTMQMALRFTF